LIISEVGTQEKKSDARELEKSEMLKKGFD
jgi:hypothetical protein